MVLHTIDPLPILRRQYDLPSKGPTQLSTLSRVFQPFDDMVAELDTQLTRIGYSFNGANLGPARPFIEKHLKGPLTGKHLVMGSAVVAATVAAVFKVNRGALKCLAVGVAGFVVTSALYQRNADKAIIATRFTRFNEALLLDLRTPAALLVLCVAIVSSSKLGFLLSGFAAAQTLMRLRKSAVKAPSEEQLTEQIKQLKSDKGWMQKPLSDRFQSRFLAFVKANSDTRLSRLFGLSCTNLPKGVHTPTEAVIKIVIHSFDDLSLSVHPVDNMEGLFKDYIHEEFIRGQCTELDVESERQQLENNGLKVTGAPTLLEGLLPVTSFKDQGVNRSILIGVVATIALRSFWCRDVRATLTAASLSFVYTHIAVDAPGGLFQSMSARLDSQEALMMAGALFITSLLTRGRLSFFVAPTMGYLMGNFAAHLHRHKRQLERPPAEEPTSLPGLVATIGDMSLEQAITSGALKKLKDLHAHMFGKDTYVNWASRQILSDKTSMLTKKGLFADLVARFNVLNQPLSFAAMQLTRGVPLSLEEAVSSGAINELSRIYSAWFDPMLQVNQDLKILLSDKDDAIKIEALNRLTAGFKASQEPLPLAVVPLAIGKGLTKQELQNVVAGLKRLRLRYQYPLFEKSLPKNLFSFDFLSSTNLSLCFLPSQLIHSDIDNLIRDWESALEKNQPHYTSKYLMPYGGLNSSITILAAETVFEQPGSISHAKRILLALRALHSITDIQINCPDGGIKAFLEKALQGVSMPLTGGQAWDTTDLKPNVSYLNPSSIEAYLFNLVDEITGSDREQLKSFETWVWESIPDAERVERVDEKSSQLLIAWGEKLKTYVGSKIDNLPSFPENLNDDPYADGGDSFADVTIHKHDLGNSTEGGFSDTSSSDGDSSW